MTVAIDCDLRTSYAVRDDDRKSSARGPLPGDVLREVCLYTPLAHGELVLFEIASPLDYTDSKAVAYNKRRWTIWNVVQATHVYLQVGDALRVSPSHRWTKGYALAVRHALAKATLAKKDLRECEAMLWFHQQTPSDWVTFPEFLAAL